jgi:hypothetical protein
VDFGDIYHGTMIDSGCQFITQGGQRRKWVMRFSQPSDKEKGTTQGGQKRKWVMRLSQPSDKEKGTTQGGQRRKWVMRFSQPSDKEKGTNRELKKKTVGKFQWWVIGTGIWGIFFFWNSSYGHPWTIPKTIFKKWLPHFQTYLFLFLY